MIRFLLSTLPVALLLQSDLIQTSVSASLCNDQAYLLSIDEIFPVGSEFYDPGETEYNITKECPICLFQDEFNIINNKFILAKELDAKVNNQKRNYKVTCTKGSSKKKATLTVAIKDFNNHAPQIKTENLNLPRFNLTEFSSQRILLQLFEADDGDVSPAPETNFVIVSVEPTGNAYSPFDFPNPKSGELKINRTLDYDDPTFDRHFTLRIIAQDAANTSLTSSATATVTVAIADMDDLAPTFLQSKYTASIDEEQPSGQEVATVEARDQDVGINETLRYSITEGDTTVFQVNETTGAISTKIVVDKEAIRSPSYLLIIKAEQDDDSKKSAITIVRITIRDINDNPPVMGQAEYKVKVSETAFPEANVITVTASDADEGENAEFMYVIEDDSSGAFQINSTSGLITVKDSSNLNATLEDSISFKVYAEETKTKPPKRSTSSTVVIEVAPGGGGGIGGVSPAKTYEDIRDAEWALIGLGAALFVGVVAAIIVLIRYSGRHRKSIDTAVHNELRRTSVETQEFTVQIHDNISDIGSVDLAALTTAPDPANVASAQGGRPEVTPDTPNGYVNIAYDGSGEKTTSRPNGNVANPEEGVDEPDDNRSERSSPDQGPSDKDTSDQDKDKDKSDKESRSSAASTPALIVRRPKMGTTGDNYIPDPEEEVNDFAQFVVTEAIMGGKLAAERAERGSDDEASGGSSNDGEKQEEDKEEGDYAAIGPPTSVGVPSGSYSVDDVSPPLPSSIPPSRVMSDLKEDEEGKDEEDEEESTVM